jgi:hypothetical protein
MKRVLAAAAISVAGGAGLADAQGADAKAAYDETLGCAGRFKWLLDASSGGQPPVQTYSLPERVKAVTTLEARAKELAGPAGADAASVPKAMLAIADETIGAFFDDPEAVEAKLAACAPLAGIR